MMLQRQPSLNRAVQRDAVSTPLKAALRARCPGVASMAGARRLRVKGQALVRQCSVKVRAAVEGSATAQKAATPTNTAAAKFDLALCTALAGPAFRAYAKPAHGFPEHHKDAAINITYTDREFLKATRQGLLCVHLMAATGLRPIDLDCKSDTYALLGVGDSSATSAVASNNNNPAWEEQKFVLFVKDFKADTLKIQLRDKDRFIDDDLACAELPLTQLQMGLPTTMTLPLAGKGVGEGAQVVVGLTTLCFTRPLLDLVASCGALVHGHEISNFFHNPGKEQSGSHLNLPDPASKEIPPSKDVPGQASKEAYDRVMACAQGADLLHARPHTAMCHIPTALAAKVVDDLEKLHLLGSETGVSKDDVMNNFWKVLAELAGYPVAWVPVAYVDCTDTETQAWVYRSKATKEVVLAFRGTEPDKGAVDWITDINFIPVSLKPDGSNKPLPNVDVHRGFRDAYASVRPTMMALLDAVCSDDCGSSDPWRVHITGHSLGAALSIMCAWDVATRKSPLRAQQQVTLYNFGSPRVGNKPFVELFNAEIPDAWRVTNDSDIVTTVPRVLGWAHVRHRVKVDNDGYMRVQAAANEDVFGEGRIGFIRGLKRVLRDEDGSCDEVMKEDAKPDPSHLQAIRNLLSKKSTEDHGEDQYYMSLRKVILDGIVAKQAEN